MPSFCAVSNRYRLGIAGLAWVLLLALVPGRAHAYVDPTSAGPLYQMLFPLIIAVASGLAAFRRTLARMWHRLASVVRRSA